MSYPALEQKKKLVIGFDARNKESQKRGKTK